MNLFTAEKISKSYSERKLLDEINFSINEGEKIGLIGINGTGKTTLLKIVAGLETADEGNIAVGNHVRIGYLPQNPIFDKESTVLEAALKNYKAEENRWTAESEAKTVLTKLGITDFEQKIGQMSGGQKKRIALASVLLPQAEILILDEPTNHLDNEMTEWLEDYLNRFKGALFMVTHDRYFLDRVTNRIVELDHGKLYSYAANYSGFLKSKEERMNREAASERKRKSILRNELAWIMRGARARSTKQKARIMRYEDLKEQEDLKEDQSIEMNSLSRRLGKKTIEIDRISKAYDGRVLFQDFTYIVLKGERIGIIGKNGCGKSTLLRIINKITEPDTGKVEIGQTVKIGYFSQENEFMDESLKVIDYIRNVAEYIKTSEGTASASQMLERFLFPPSMQYTYIEKLSGGEKRRLYLLRVLMEAPNVLILDEPTNDLDIRTLTILEDYLDQFDGIVITVSHDRYFLDRVARRIFAFEEDGKIKQYEGGYSDYLFAFERDHLTEERENAVKEKKSVQNGRIREKKLKFTYMEQKEFETIEEDIALLEGELEGLKEAIGEAASDYVRLNELMTEKTELEDRLEQKMERFVYLSDLAEKIEEERRQNR